jgi:hypothetical protein
MWRKNEHKEWEIIWEEVTRPYSKVPFQYSLGESEENHENVNKNLLPYIGINM